MEDAVPSAAWVQTPDGQRTPVHGNLGIGRTAGNDLVLVDDRISRRHATIHRQGETEFWLVDLGSRNGTYLNGRRVQQPARLYDRDRIGIGPNTLVFRQPAAPQGRAPFGEESTGLRTITEIRRLPCWLLVADVIGSTSRARELGADEHAVQMGRWFARCKRVVEAHGGVLNKYLGDGWLAYWEEARVRPEDILNLVEAIRAMAVPDLPPFRLALHLGETLMGGGASLGEESLSGPAVNFVFRLEQLAGVLGEPCLLSAPAARALQGLHEARPAGEHELAGFAGAHPVFAWRGWHA